MNIYMYIYVYIKKKYIHIRNSPIRIDSNFNQFEFNSGRIADICCSLTCTAPRVQAKSLRHWIRIGSN